MLIRVGLGSCGIASGGRKVIAALEANKEEYGLDYIIKTTGCIGMCFYEPIVDVITDNGSVTYGYVDMEMAEEIVEKHVKGGEILKDKVIYTSEKIADYELKQYKIALEGCGIIDPESIDEYIEMGGYKGMKRALKEMNPESIIEEIKVSGLRGRGGAGFPTWFKWDAARKSKDDQKYIVCNADEGDPGAFMDRSIIEGNPHRLIEAMIIGGYAIGANEGIIYCRAEYPLAIERLELAMEQASKMNILGEDLLGTGFNFNLTVKKGAGAFVCGEETALLESLEGKRGMPRLKPPFPAQSGYWRKPTNINNAETLANVPFIISKGAKEYAKVGSEKSKGTKVFALSGKIKNGGLVEIPMGVTLREVIFDIGGGIKGGRKFKAIQMGGPSGGCIPASLLDTPVTYEDLNETGAIMGSGGMVVMDETTCMVDIAKFFLGFTCKESCGKCIYCRIGTKRMHEILEKITEGKGERSDLEELESLAHSISDASLCGLGQTAPNPVLTGLKYFRNEYEAHIVEKKCPAKVCTDLLKYEIDQKKCVGCTLCASNCPVDAIEGDRKEVHVIDKIKCIKCGNCVMVCKFGAVKVQ